MPVSIATPETAGGGGGSKKGATPGAVAERLRDVRSARQFLECQDPGAAHPACMGGGGERASTTCRDGLKGSAQRL